MKGDDLSNINKTNKELKSSGGLLCYIMLNYYVKLRFAMLCYIMLC